MTNRELALMLLEVPEPVLGDPADAVTLDLAFACAIAGYEPGNLFLQVCRMRGAAARANAMSRLFCLTELVNEIRDRFLVRDAETSPSSWSEATALRTAEKSGTA
jgi:hypothetical protein